MKLSPYIKLSLVGKLYFQKSMDLLQGAVIKCAEIFNYVDGRCILKKWGMCIHCKGACAFTVLVLKTSY